MAEIRGTTASEFEELAEVFEKNFELHNEVGAGFSVYLEGEKVVDLTGGVADSEGRPYDDDTLQMVFSTTKGITAMCAHLLVQRGELDLDAPVTQYWPEFAEADKASIPVSWLLCHRSGLIDVDRPMTLDQALDWDAVTSALAASKPVWEPGTNHGYHAVTYGWLVGEVIRRVTGRSIGDFVQQEISGPLGAEFWIGLPDVQQARVAPLIPMSMEDLPIPAMAGDGGSGDGGSGGSADAPSGLIEMLDKLLGPGNLAGRALSAPGGALAAESVWNEPRVRAAQIPAANGVTNASSLARCYASLVSTVDGKRLLEESTVRAAIKPQVEGPDAVLVFPIPFGLGFMTHSEMSPFLGGSSFGHYGAGGSVGFADPDRRIAGGYVMNKMHMGLAGDPRSGALLECTNRLMS